MPTHIYAIVVGHDLASVEHPVTTTQALQDAKAKGAQALSLTQHPQFTPTVEGWQSLNIRGEANLAVVAKMETHFP